MQHGAVSFAPPRSRKKPRPIVASTALGPEFPYWGFDVPRGKFTIAEPVGDFFRVYVPEGARVERRQPTAADFQPVGSGDMEDEGGHRYLALSNGAQARFTSGGMTLYAWVGPPAEKVHVSPLHGLPWLLIAILVVLSAGAGGFLIFAPEPRDEPDFTAKGLDPVAVRLAIAEPEKKKTAREKVKQIKEKASAEIKEKKISEKKGPAVVVKSAAPESKALKQLAKLTAAGPAMGDMLAAVDKLGNGPGSKNARSNFKLSGLVGKAPIANAGIGTFGLGGGGKGGIGTLGAEILRGRGGGGIGAMGAGSVGRGAVGGMVTRATSRSVGVPQGNIDREAVAKVINSHLQEIRGCYERALLKDPGLAGKVVLEWTISTTGSVSAAKTKSSTLKNASVEGCILSALKSWQFPQPRGGVVIISYPFLFNSVGF
jgi:outer membrane biosynthesis protein TonB